MSKFHSNESSELATNTYEKVGNLKEGSGEKNFKLGSYAINSFLGDPKRFGFMLSRHKFVAKMMNGFENVLEVGCQEGIGSIVVSQGVKNLTSVDFYTRHIDTAQTNTAPELKNVTFKKHDIIDGPVEGKFNGAFSLDVFEHIDPKQADLYFKNILTSLSDEGVFIVGVPSKESQIYASEASKIGHINVMTGEELNAFCKKYYKNVFMFGMNDEVVHTGFMPMSHYLFAVCVGPKK